MNSDRSRYSWQEAAVLSIEGKQAAEFLQGYVTADTRRLTGAVCLPAALCNLQGRVVSNGWLLTVNPEHIAFIVHASLAEDVKRFLAPYARFSRCALNLGVVTPLLNRDSKGLVLSGAWCIELGTEVSGSEALHDASAAVNRALVEADFAWVSAATSAQFLPQMLGLDGVGAVDFDKGCYLGQEIVARAQHRGRVKRRLSAFSWQGTPPVSGEKNDQGSTVVMVACDENDPHQGSALAVT